MNVTRIGGQASLAIATHRAHNFLSLVVGFCFGSVACLRACTVFSDSSDGTVLAGRNWDMTECKPVMWFVPAQGGKHGRICFGRSDDCEDGMNDQGLFIAVAAAPPSGRFLSSQRPIQCPVALDQILAHCATVEEAIAWWKKHAAPAINSTIPRTHFFLGIRFLPMGNYLNSGIGGHVLIADKSGNSVVCEWEKGKLKVIPNTGRYQLITNFLVSKPDAGGSCPRFAAATRILDEAARPSIATCVAALKAASSREFTKYSVVYDLARGDAHVYGRGRFDNLKTVRLSEALQKGPHETQLDAWFAEGLSK